MSSENGWSVTGCRWSGPEDTGDHRRWLLILALIACTSTERATDTSRATAALERGDSAGASIPTPARVSPNSPWPADTHDVSIGHFSFEVPAEREKAPRCRDEVPVVTADSVGPMRAGQTLEELRRACPALLFGWYYTDDQTWAPVAVARLGEGVALALLDGTAPTSRVTLVAALDSTFRTPDGIGPRMPLFTVRSRLGDPALVPRKCAVFARWPSRPGLVARLLLPDETGWECSAMRKLGSDNDLRKVPAGTLLGFIAQERP